MNLERPPLRTILKNRAERLAKEKENGSRSNVPKDSNAVETRPNK